MLALLTVVFGTAWGGSITFADLGLENGVQYTDPFDEGDFTVTFSGGANDGKYYTTGSGIRVYGNGSMTVAAKSGNLSQITITFSGAYKPETADVVDNGTYDPETGVWTGSAASVVFTRPAGSGHWRIQKVEAVVGGASPTLSINGTTPFVESTQVTITPSNPDFAVYYSTDGSDPIVNGVTYSSPITVMESTTIKAVAVKDGNTSEVATAAYVIEEVSTDFAETFDLCDGTGGNDGLFSGSVASGAFKPDNEGWVATSSFGAKQCARFGSSKKAGIVTTPTFFLEGEATLTFKAVPWGNDGTNLKLTVNGNAELSQTQLAMKTGEWTSYSLTLTGNGSVSITFTPDLRFFLDDIFVITEKEDWLIGDVNKDNLITVIDVTLLVDIILGNQNPN